ncbi:hypothetical protein DPMN_133455 [Dreissena polymorpha]|uniref:Uncharacterized protein n=1 Tax=Dreissena polymorpha TaxID=45954 RepID=A0A9D4JCX7_DREPO|nr:hypothetical protein DPMN_133455 [Dreissena polymorpha]
MALSQAWRLNTTFKIIQDRKSSSDHVTHTACEPSNIQPYGQQDVVRPTMQHPEQAKQITQ